MNYSHYINTNGGNLLVLSGHNFDPTLFKGWRYCCTIEGNDRAEVAERYEKHLQELDHARQNNPV